MAIGVWPAGHVGIVIQLPSSIFAHGLKFADVGSVQPKTAPQGKHDSQHTGGNEIAVSSTSKVLLINLGHQVENIQCLALTEAILDLPSYPTYISKDIALMVNL